MHFRLLEIGMVLVIVGVPIAMICSVTGILSKGFCNVIILGLVAIFWIIYTYAVGVTKRSMKTEEKPENKDDSVN